MEDNVDKEVIEADIISDSADKFKFLEHNYIPMIIYSTEVGLGIYFRYFLKSIEVSLGDTMYNLGLFFLNISVVAGKWLFWLGLYGVLMTFVSKKLKKFPIYYMYSSIAIALISLMYFII